MTVLVVVDFCFVYVFCKTFFLMLVLLFCKTLLLKVTESPWEIDPEITKELSNKLAGCLSQIW